MATLYFRGNIAMSTKLMAKLREQGATNILHLKGDDPSIYYTVHPAANNVTGVNMNSLAASLLLKYGTEITPQDVNDALHIKEDDYVLVRDSNDDTWHLNNYIRHNPLASDIPGLFLTKQGIWVQCIPYKGNEPLLGTNKSAPKGVDYIYD